MEDVYLTLSFSYHNFPLSKYWKVKHFQPPPFGELRNKRKVLLLFLPLFQLTLPCGDYISLNAPQLLIRMIYRILKSICAALNYGKLRISSDCHRSQSASAAAPAMGSPSAAGDGAGWTGHSLGSDQLARENWRKLWCGMTPLGHLGGLSMTARSFLPYFACVPLRLDVTLFAEVALQPIHMQRNHPQKRAMVAGFCILGCGDIALDLGEGKGNCAITWLIHSNSVSQTQRFVIKDLVPPSRVVVGTSGRQKK